MLIEQDITFQKEPGELLQIIFDKDIVDEKDEKDVKMKYFGERNESFFKSLSKGTLNIEEIISLLKDQNDPRNHIIYIKYKDIYIGGISLFDLKMREGFGLNIYDNDSFYIGKWKNNRKEGIGFLNMNNSRMYIGNFKENNFDGFGILYYKDKGIIYFGEFNKGYFSKGVYFNEEKGLFYRGRFKDNKKDDTFCSFYEMSNDHIFIGEADEDVFVKGYVGVIKLLKDGENITINTEYFFYFDKTDEKNTRFIPNYVFEKDFHTKVLDSLESVIESDYGLYQEVEDILNYFDKLEKISKDKSYNNDIDNYNSLNDKISFEKNFLEEYELYVQMLQENGISLDLETIKEEIETPNLNTKLIV